MEKESSFVCSRPSEKHKTLFKIIIIGHTLMHISDHLQSTRWSERSDRTHHSVLRNNIVVNAITAALQPGYYNVYWTPHCNQRTCIAMSLIEWMEEWEESKEVPEFLKKNETLVLIPKKTFLHISQVFRTTRYNLGLISLLRVAAVASPLMTSWQLTLSINLGVYELPVGFSGCCLLLIQWSPLGTRSSNFDLTSQLGPNETNYNTSQRNIKLIIPRYVIKYEYSFNKFI